VKVTISPTERESGKAAAGSGASLIRAALMARGRAYIVLATGTSQFEMLDNLVKQDIDWSRITVFHLDEYIGIPMSHPASFRRYLKERFCDQIPATAGKFHYIEAEKDPKAKCERLGKIISQVTIDVAFVGIGENCHLAFNDPPADFQTERPYIIVDLDETCRRQQLGEGWFTTLDVVPKQAISMSIRQIMKSRSIICTVPHKRKAEAVLMALEEPVTPHAPASILQTHPDCRIFLDKDSASLLTAGHDD
jgi:glucosamine-6-phosphate deaminase